MDNVEWKNLGFMGYGNYSVSNDGQVRNDKRGNIRKNILNNNGYYCITFNKKRVSVHRLVAIAFIPNPDNLPEVNHKDKCRINNQVDNLEWCDKRYNLEYSKINKPVDCYSKDGEYIKTYWSINEAYKECNTNYTYIIACCRGEKNYAGEYRWAYSGCKLHDIIEHEEYVKDKKKYHSDYYKEYKEEILKRQKEYYQKNKEKINARHLDYYYRKKNEGS